MTATTTTPPRVRFPALDGLRALACYLILATHVGYQSGTGFGHNIYAPWLTRFDIAVPIFLMLSGFLLYRPYAVNLFTGRPVAPTLQFWWRRAVRILPAYWLTIVVVLGLLSSRTASGLDWFSYLGLIQIYNGHQVDPSLSQMWTLCTEVSFYVALPFLAALAGRLGSDVNQRLRRQMALFAVIVCGAIAFQISTFHFTALGYVALDWLPSTIDWFVAGMLLAVLSSVPKDCTALVRFRATLQAWAQAPLLCWAIAVIILWFVTLPVGGPLTFEPSTTSEWLIRHHLETLSVVFMMVPVTLGGGGIIGRILGGRVAKFLGDISYGVYLWHLPMLTAIHRYLGLPIFQGRFWEYYLLTAGSATVLGTLSWFYLERPLLLRLSGRTRGTVVARDATSTTPVAAAT